MTTSAVFAFQKHAKLLIADEDEEDLKQIVDTAISFTSQHIGMPELMQLTELPAPGGDELLQWETVAPEVRHAILMLAAHWYENREATLIGVTGVDVPLGYWDLVLLHRPWTF